MGFSDVFSQWKTAASEEPTADDQGLAEQAIKGGFSYNHKFHTEPTSGYMVGIHSSMGGVANVVKTHTPHEVAQAIATHRKRMEAGGHFDDPNVFQGGWHDPSTGNVHLDSSRNIEDRDEAIAEGKKHKQIAIWDVHNMKEIPTGGKGEAHGED